MLQAANSVLKSSPRTVKRMYDTAARDADKQFIKTLQGELKQTQSLVVTLKEELSQARRAATLATAAALSGGEGMAIGGAGAQPTHGTADGATAAAEAEAKLRDAYDLISQLTDALKMASTTSAAASVVGGAGPDIEGDAASLDSGAAAAGAAATVTTDGVLAMRQQIRNLQVWRARNGCFC
jgi:hypothetical protein